MTTLRLVPVDDAVVFPGMPVTMAARVGADARVFLIPRHQNAYAKVGVVAEVSERNVGGRRRMVSTRVRLPIRVAPVSRTRLRTPREASWMPAPGAQPMCAAPS